MSLLYFQQSAQSFLSLNYFKISHTFTEYYTFLPLIRFEILNSHLIDFQQQCLN